MKKLFVVIGVTFVLLSCNKEAEIKPQLSTSSTSANAYRKAAKTDEQELQTLIRIWTEWALSGPFAEAPFNDPDGSWQDDNQPYGSGVFMLANAFSPELVERTVTISLSQYQYIFVNLVGTTAYYSPCETTFLPHGKQSQESYFQSQIKETANGPRELILTWNGVSLLSNKEKDVRANSGVWSFDLHSDYTGCTEEGLDIVYSDGFWAKIPIPQIPGEYELVIGGDLSSNRKNDKFTFSNIIEYTIHVVD